MGQWAWRLQAFTAKGYLVFDESVGVGHYKDMDLDILRRRKNIGYVVVTDLLNGGSETFYPITDASERSEDS